MCKNDRLRAFSTKLVMDQCTVNRNVWHEEPI
jgi:hypothetical protein